MREETQQGQGGDFNLVSMLRELSPTNGSTEVTWLFCEAADKPKATPLGDFPS